MKTLTASQVIERILERVGASTLIGVARECKIDAGQLCRALNGKIPLSEGMARKLGYEKLADRYAKRA